MLSIGEKPLDDPSRIFIIAEMSGNHGKSFSQAQKLVKAAADAGADAIKVQTFTAEEICADVPILFGHDAVHDAWCKALGVTRMRELFAKGGFPRMWHAHLKDYAEQTCGVEFLSTPFSVDAAKFLVEEVGVRALKIASGDLTFTPLLEYAAQTSIPTILSTGGATLQDIREALDTMCDICPDSWPGLVLLHCVSIYPCAPRDANLAAITTLREHPMAGGWPVGFSDHTLSAQTVPAAAAALGVSVYEKHLTLQRGTGEVDAAHSLEPQEFAKMVAVLRAVPGMCGDGLKVPQQSEFHDVLWARRDPSDWLRPTRAAREGVWA